MGYNTGMSWTGKQGGGKIRTMSVSMKTGACAQQEINLSDWGLPVQNKSKELEWGTLEDRQETGNEYQGHK